MTVIFAFRLKDLDNAVDPVGIFMELVSPELDAGHQGKQNETGHPDGHSDDVDKRINLLFLQVSQSDQYITFEHNGSPLKVC